MEEKERDRKIEKEREMNRRLGEASVWREVEERGESWEGSWEEKG